MSYKPVRHRTMGRKPHTPTHKSQYTDEELALIHRRNAENWLSYHHEWLERLRRGVIGADLAENPTYAHRKRLNAGMEFGVLTLRDGYWKLTPYAEEIIKELKL